MKTDPPLPYFKNQFTFLTTSGASFGMLAKTETRDQVFFNSVDFMDILANIVLTPPDPTLGSNEGSFCNTTTYHFLWKCESI